MNRRHFIAATVAGGLAMPAVAQESEAKSLPERFAATLSAHDIAAFGAIFADDYVNHQVSAAASPPPPDKSPKQATVGFFAARLAGIPDLQVAVETTVASNDMVAASFVYTGTHKGPIRDRPDWSLPSLYLLRYFPSKKRTVHRALGHG